MKNFWRWLTGTTSLTSTYSNPTRDAANVIADAVTAARDEQIAKAEAELRLARRITRLNRARLHIAFDDVSRLFQANVAAMGNDIGNGFKHHGDKP